MTKPIACQHCKGTSTQVFDKAADRVRCLTCGAQRWAGEWYDRKSWDALMDTAFAKQQKA